MKSFLRFFSYSLLLLAALSCDILGGKRASTALSVTLPEDSDGMEEGSVKVVVRASGEWELSLDYEGEQSGWASLSHTRGSGYKSNIHLTFEKNDSGEPRKVHIVLETDYDATECIFTQTTDEAEPVGGTSDKADRTWMELPETKEGDGLTWCWHSMVINEKRVRNYSFYWSSSDHLSLWVAYPLNKNLISSGDRTNIWSNFDPFIPQSEQVCTPYGIFNGYQRGHQIPSADRYSYLGNLQTFYPTNMTPQLGRFNGGIWAGLEGKVRDWAKPLNSLTDTLYVVTGCILEGSTRKVQAGGTGPAATVPTAYYKALLRYTKSSGYSACGVWLDHFTSATVTTRSDLMSISDLEKKVGVNFFVNLPAKVGVSKAEEIETKEPSEALWPL